MCSISCVWRPDSGSLYAGCFWMPTDGESKTKGCAFIEYSRKEVHSAFMSAAFLTSVACVYLSFLQEAFKAVKEMDGYRLDKSHLIRAFLLDDLDRLDQVPSQYSTPPTAPFDAEVCRFCRPCMGKTSISSEHYKLVCVTRPCYILNFEIPWCRSIMETWRG